MQYIDGFNRGGFLEYMFDEFPSVFREPFAREMLENIVDYGMKNHNTSKNGLYYFLKDVLPEVEPRDLIPFMDKEMLTNEVLAQAMPAQGPGARGQGPGNVFGNSNSRMDLNEDATERVSLCQTKQSRWDIFVDDACVYAFDIDSEKFVDMSLDELDVFIDECVEAMQEALGEEEMGADSCLSHEDIEYLKGLMFGAWEEYTDGMRYVSTMEELKGYFEKNGWEVSDYPEEGAFEIERQTPLGVDFSVYLQHDGDVETAIQELQDYAEEHDPEDLADLYLNDRGARASDALIEDMEWVLEMLEALADGVGFCGADKEVESLLTDAENRAKQPQDRKECCVVTFRKTTGPDLDEFNVLLDIVPEDYQRLLSVVPGEPWLAADEFVLNVEERQMAYEKAVAVVGDDEISHYVIGSARMERFWVETSCEKDAQEIL